MAYKVIQQTDGPVPGYETVVVEIEVEPGTIAPRHTHPGVESTYVIAGHAELTIDGQPARTLQAGDVFQIPAGIVHSMKIGNAVAKACSILVVEKGKALVLPP
jgi:quercetin dioxygenase-like cupin family protein